MDNTLANDMESPDLHGMCMTGEELDPLRYEQNDTLTDPVEASGILRHMIPSGIRLLDVGCGTGSLTIALNKDKNNDVLAIEPDLDRCKSAQQRRLNAIFGLLDSKVFESIGKFDVVILTDVLEHSPSPAELLSVCRNALNSGGRLLISVPNVAHWSVRLMVLCGRFDYAPTGIMDSTHLRWFTEKSLRDLLFATGFSITDVRYSAELSLTAYRGKFLRKLPYKAKRLVVVSMKHLLPRLFGAQFVISANKSQ